MATARPGRCGRGGLFAELTSNRSWARLAETETALQLLRGAKE